MPLLHRWVYCRCKPKHWYWFRVSSTSFNLTRYNALLILRKHTWSACSIPLPPLLSNYAYCLHSFFQKLYCSLLFSYYSSQSLLLECLSRFLLLNWTGRVFPLYFMGFLFTTFLLIIIWNNSVISIINCVLQYFNSLMLTLSFPGALLFFNI